MILNGIKVLDKFNGKTKQTPEKKVQIMTNSFSNPFNHCYIREEKPRWQYFKLFLK